ncbi:NXPE family member 3-like [Synchiropus splendidus]|uniref:NXPE family member 3-like n=1 Tax=Synchiropus splendidus TaxID=270530 RepID=UPI00237E2319|nr:NXPE family member 3-like [Synchiropus splendidus]
MEVKVCITDKSSCQKCLAVFVFLVLLVSVLLSHYLDFNFKDQWRFPVIMVVQDPDRMQDNSVVQINLTAPSNIEDFCVFRPLSPENTLEERLLLESTAWPETPSVPANFYLSKTSNPLTSSFIILPKDGGQQWHVGEELTVMIEMKDFHGNPKKTGGDFIIARVHNPDLHAGATGRIVDHLNGSYSAVFPLLWSGRADVEVTLVHPSEAITVLGRLTKERPDRVQFVSLFSQGKETETAICNVCLRPTEAPICDFTDVKTREPWFCYKPKKLDCDSRVIHSRTNFRVTFGPYGGLFQSKINMKVPIPPSGGASVNVLPQIKDMKSRPEFSQPGYYYKGVWQRLSGTPVHHFNSSVSISHCLQNKRLYFYGDSTVRQWYEYLTGRLPNLRPFNFNSVEKVGPFMSIDYRRNTMVSFRVHGPPLRFTPLPVAELRYIANELDALAGGADTVVIFGIWAHFSTFPNEIYIRRLQSIRGAVMRLLNRAPDTVVVIRTANLRYLTPAVAWTNSDFYTFERDKILRAVFKCVNVRWVDAWDMTLAHYLPHAIHPKSPIIKNMIDVLLSYICPRRIF